MNYSQHVLLVDWFSVRRGSWTTCVLRLVSGGMLLAPKSPEANVLTPVSLPKFEYRIVIRNRTFYRRISCRKCPNHKTWGAGQGFHFWNPRTLQPATSIKRHENQASETNYMTPAVYFMKDRTKTKVGNASVVRPLLLHSHSRRLSCATTKKVSRKLTRQKWSP